MEDDMAKTLLMAGTRKGVFIGTSDERREDWEWTGPFFDVDEVYSVMIDTRGAAPRLLAGGASMWLGPQVHRSDDLGKTWESTPNGGPTFPDDVDASVARIWQLHPGPDETTVYAGTEPGAIFRSQDRGEHFELVRGLWDHPHRPEWSEGFGGQAFHTILPHPTDPRSVTAAISTGGVYQTRDGGETWEPRNQGIRADFLPEGKQFPEFGQCVHKITRHPARPERLYLQNHGGVYRSDDEAESWHYIADGLPADFGFAVAVHPHEPDTIFVFPIDGGANRYPPEGKARVWRSRDAGGTWEELGAAPDGGLPDRFFVGVMRDGMCTDAHASPGVYIGARNGSVYASADAGETWREIVRDLPDVVVVRAAALD
jgi:photosystem II stability/assembly factor-like uncharacterized protein